jgi:hypothetical protein
VPATTAVDLLAAALVLGDGRRWGEVAEPLQLADAAALLEQLPWGGPVLEQALLASPKFRVVYATATPRLRR